MWGGAYPSLNHKSTPLCQCIKARSSGLHCLWTARHHVSLDIHPPTSEHSQAISFLPPYQPSRISAFLIVCRSGRMACFQPRVKWWGLLPLQGRHHLGIILHMQTCIFRCSKTSGTPKFHITKCSEIMPKHFLQSSSNLWYSSSVSSFHVQFISSCCRFCTRHITNLALSPLGSSTPSLEYVHSPVIYHCSNFLLVASFGASVPFLCSRFYVMSPSFLPI